MNQPSPYTIFITYRREDSQDTVGRIYDRLKDRFGRDAVFKDVDSVPAGYSFPSYINHVLGQCRVVLVVIGPIWATVIEKEGVDVGQPRLNDPEDRVRIEVEWALELSPVDAVGRPTSDLLLIPLLVQDSRMPAPEQLPESLRNLTKRNARQIHRDPDFEHDIQRLMSAIAQWMGTTAAPVPIFAPPTAGKLPPLGPAPAPANSVSAYHLTPMRLYNLGYRGYSVNGVECILPPICPVPAGVFTMGSDKNFDEQAYDDETPQYPVEVDGFAIGQHPVTVAEYACAVRANAVREPPLWEYRDWKVDWVKQRLHFDHPVVCVSWNEACVYTSWLAKVVGQPWRLPTEAEWEKAARGSDGRTYPWGDRFDTSCCNTAEIDIGATTAVGSYPSGESLYHAQDTAGNVWEWTSSLYVPYPYRKSDGRENLDSIDENRVLRGGSWVDSSRSARVAYRSGSRPGYFSVGDVGFRLALAAGGSA
jgi:formylglycine-generating enzyme required for sulfatase activity